MRRLVMLLVAGGLLVPAVGWASFPYPCAYTWQGCLWHRHATSPTLDCSEHIAIDLGNSIGTRVNAIAKGYDIMILEPHKFGGCTNSEEDRGWLLMIKHRKANGEYFWALYGHVQNYVSASPSTAGQKVAEIADYAPCCGGSASCPHLHFAIWDDASIPTAPYGYGTDRLYVDPEVFLANESPYPEGPTYIALKLDQNESVTPWMAPNTSRTMWVDYRNDGTATWSSSVELRSLTGSDPCVLTNGCAYDPADWLSQQRITSANQSSVAAGSTARFEFQAKAGSVTGSCVQWVAPWVPGGTCMQGWGGVNFTIRTDATVPQGALAVGAPPPGTYSSDITIGFVVNDAHSGGRGYAVGWDNPSISGPEVAGTSGSTTLAAQGAGSHTLYLRVWDNVGNTTISNLGLYTYQPPTDPCAGGPCPGRYIPSSCLPEPGMCCPNSAANLQQLPDMGAVQWETAGMNAANLLLPGASYSLGLEYRTRTESSFQLGFGSLNPSRDLGLVVNQTSLPRGNGEWRTFWSAPFAVSSKQLRDFPRLRFLTANPDGIEFRNVRMLSQ